MSELMREKKKMEKIEEKIIYSMQNHDFETAIYLDNKQKQIKENLKTIASDKNINPLFAKIIREDLLK